ncbi:MAG TPA: hypothetical protein VJ765_08425, partial [Chitinophagaceae bacterium]|nr:hypothetical protein [Chitinophagaceae bacterium]
CSFATTCRTESSSMNFEKENFLRVKFISLLQKLRPDTIPLWGKMNVQQMIEHFTDSMMVASGKISLPIMTPADKLPKFQEFLTSEKPFKENTKNPVLAEEPPPLKKHTKEAAIGKLNEELIHFFEVFEKQPGLKTTNPVFGELDFDMNIQLLHKHALHHLRQFGVNVQ